MSPFFFSKTRSSRARVTPSKKLKFTRSTHACQGLVTPDQLAKAFVYEKEGTR
jgi:hypothetical protein